MKNFTSLVAISALVLTASPAFAASHAGAPMAKEAAPKTAVAPAVDTANMADGEVRKIDKETKKITLKHGVIKSMDMPAMTMVFGVKDAAMLDNLKVGDKVKFTAASVNGSLMVRTLQPKP